MEFLFELLLQFLGELAIQVIGELLVEFGLHAIAEPFRRRPRPWMSAVGYALLGTLAGALSLWAFPALFFKTEGGKLAGLLFTPVVSGGAMALMGVWRRSREQEPIRLDRFACGYLFAIAMALMRYRFGH